MWAGSVLSTGVADVIKWVQSLSSYNKKRSMKVFDVKVGI